MRWKWIGGALLDRKLVDGVDGIINAERWIADRSELTVEIDLS